MTVKLVGDKVIFTGEDGKAEDVFGQPKKYVPAEAPKQMLHGCEIDARHPYLIHIAGVPVFAASTTLPDRVKAMVAQGVPTCMFQVLDTRDGAVYGWGCNVDRSVQSEILSLVEYCLRRAENDKVKPRKEALLKVAEKLEELAQGRYVNRLKYYGD